MSLTRTIRRASKRTGLNRFTLARSAATYRAKIDKKRAARKARNEAAG